MSVVLSLFVNRLRMPSPVEWATAIRSSGFDMDLDTECDLGSHSGFLPCKYSGSDAGFEYFLEPAADGEFPDHVSALIGGFDTTISFVTHSDLKELATAMAASGVLCSMCDGVLWETEADEVVLAAQALDWARKGEAGVREALGKARQRRR